MYTRSDAVEIATGFLRTVWEQHRIRRAFLFGSTVWGRPEAHSDIDLALIVDPAADGDGVDAREAFELFHAAQEWDSALEVVCFTPEEFDEGGGALARRIREAGIEIPMPPGTPASRAA